jgi:hypothetical protein
MHPYMIELLARIRHQELERAVAAWRAAHPDGSTRQKGLRRRPGRDLGAGSRPTRTPGIGAVPEPTASGQPQAPTLQDSLR